EVTWPKPAAQSVREALHGHRAQRLDGVHLVHGRREHEVDTELVADLEVRVQRARIALEVIFAIELKRVDEDADNDGVAALARSLNQPSVTPMQRAHGRHEPDPLAGAPAG